MLKLYKCPIRGAGFTVLELPAHSQIVSAAFLNNELVVWAQVTNWRTNKKHHVYVAQTGDELPEEIEERARFIGTVYHSKPGDEWAFVLHVFVIDPGGQE